MSGNGVYGKNDFNQNSLLAKSSFNFVCKEEPGIDAFSVVAIRNSATTYKGDLLPDGYILDIVSQGEESGEYNIFGITTKDVLAGELSTALIRGVLKTDISCTGKGFRTAVYYNAETRALTFTKTPYWIGYVIDQDNDLIYFDFHNFQNVSLLKPDQFETVGQPESGELTGIDRILIECGSEGYVKRYLPGTAFSGSGSNFGKVFFVDATNGNDTTATGQAAKPFKTIEAAVSYASTGFLIYVLPGSYTVASNIAKAGVNFYFSAGAVITKTTAGFLFDYTAISGTDNIIIKGDGVFNCTYGFFDRNHNTNIVDLTEIEFSKITVTNAMAIYYDWGKSRTIKINGDISCSGGCSISMFITYTDQIFINGKNYGTTSSGTTYIYPINIAGTSYQNVNVFHVGITENTTNGCAVYCIGNYSYTGIIKGTTAGYGLTVGELSQTVFNGTLEGNIQVINAGSGIGSLTFNGLFKKGTFTNSGGNYNTTSIFNLTENNGGAGSLCHFVNSGGLLKISGSIRLYDDGATALISSNGANALTQLDLILSGVGNEGHYIDISAGTIDDRSLIYNGNGSGGGAVWMTGGLYIFSGVWNKANGSAINMEGGTFYLKNGYINIANGPSFYAISVTENATFKHNGGTLVVAAATTNAITVASGKTLTIKNYNSYYTNYARGGAGTYSETITGGGTEVVDTDVD